MGLTRAEDESPGWELVRPRRVGVLGLETATLRDSQVQGLAGPRALGGRLQSLEGEGFWRKKGEALSGRGPE